MEAFVKRQIFYSPRVFLEKTLPKDGEILVKVGETVLPFNILGHTYLSLDHKRIALERGARVMVSEGEEVTAGQILAKKSTLVRTKNFKAPISGTVHLDEENNLIQVSSYPERFNLISGIEAKVVKILPKVSVLLQTAATAFQGVWSQGSEAVGEIVFHELEEGTSAAKDFGAESSGKIVIFPGFVTEGLIQKARALGVAGLVCASIEGNRPLASKTDQDSLPILVTEGFGPAQMPKRLIGSFRQATLKTAVISPPRRQLIVPDYQEKELSSPLSFSESQTLKVDDQVQILTWPYFAEEALVTELLGETRFESGVFAEGVLVKRLKNNEVVKIPITNLLILGDR